MAVIQCLDCLHDQPHLALTLYEEDGRRISRVEAVEDRWERMVVGTPWVASCTVTVDSDQVETCSGPEPPSRSPTRIRRQRDARVLHARPLPQARRRVDRLHMLVELYARSQDEATDVLESAARGDLAITSLAEESRPPAAGTSGGGRTRTEQPRRGRGRAIVAGVRARGWTAPDRTRRCGRRLVCLARVAAGPRTGRRPAAVLRGMASVTLVTATLNLDTAVVFLTPVMIVAAGAGGSTSGRSSTVTIFMANAGLAVPAGSNLTNLIVARKRERHRLGVCAAHAPGGDRGPWSGRCWRSGCCTGAGLGGGKLDRRLPRGRVDRACRQRVIVILLLVLREPALPIAALGVVTVA